MAQERSRGRWTRPLGPMPGFRTCSVDLRSVVCRPRQQNSVQFLVRRHCLMSEKGQSLPKLPAPVPPNVRFSNRPFRAKHFQTIRRCSVDVAHGLALLFGIGAALQLSDLEDEVEQSLQRPCRQTRNGRSKRTCELTSSIVPRGTSSTARWSSSFLLLDLIL